MATESLLQTSDPLWEILLRLGINLTVLFIIIKLIYARRSDNKGNMFAFFLMGVMIFTVCVLLKKVEIQMGMVLGLFAIFSIVRFRTMNLTVKDMSYLFAVIGISAINALLDFPNPLRGTLIVNSTYILTVLILEFTFKEDNVNEGPKKDKKKRGRRLSKHQVIYDKFELLGQDKMEDLLTDVAKRTGFRVTKVKIRKIDLIKNYADLDIYCDEKISGSEN